MKKDKIVVLEEQKTYNSSEVKVISARKISMIFKF